LTFLAWDLIVRFHFRLCSKQKNMSFRAFATQLSPRFSARRIARGACAPPLCTIVPHFRSFSNYPSGHLAIDADGDGIVDCVHTMMIREPYQFDNDTLTMLAIEGNQDAVKERLIREIMSKDEIDWDEANTKFAEIEKANMSGMLIHTLPYKIGIVTAGVVGLATFPLCFDLEVAKWFNEFYVTTEVADPADLETWLEVGSWTWGWMEPPLGQMSFFLLCLQYSRAQLDKMGRKPFTAYLIKKRGASLSKKYPKYHSGILEAYSENTGLS